MAHPLDLPARRATHLPVGRAAAGAVALAMALTMPLAMVALGGCSSQYATSFLLTPGNAATFSADGRGAFASIHNRGPGQVTATFTAADGGSAVHAIAPEIALGEMLRERRVRLEASGGNALVELEVRNASGFDLSVLPTKRPGTKP
jgi:hypothetical protein